MSYYNTITSKVSPRLPRNIPSDIGFTANPTHEQLMQAGWLMAEIVPFTVPEGYVVIAGTRRVEVAQLVPYEMWDTETEQVAHDRDVDSERVIAENMPIFKIIFKMVNLHRPAAIKVTVAEARAIVNSVIN